MKRINDNLNGNGTCYCNETSLTRLLGKHTNNGYVIISACRHDWDKEDELKNRKMNNIKTKELKQDIYDSGFQYIPVKDGFREKGSDEPVVEDSFVVVVNFKRKSSESESDMSELKELALDWCGKYNQDSVLVVEPGKNPTYYTKNGDVDMEFSGKVDARQMVDAYFTRLGGGREFTFVEGAEQPGTLNGMRSRRIRGEICELYNDYKFKCNSHNRGNLKDCSSMSVTESSVTRLIRHNDEPDFNEVNGFMYLKK